MSNHDEAARELRMAAERFEAEGSPVLDRAADKLRGRADHLIRSAEEATEDIREQLAAALVRAGWEAIDLDTIEALVPVVEQALDAGEARGRAEVEAKIEGLVARWERTARRADQDGEAVAAAVRLHAAAGLRALVAETKQSR